MAMRNGGQRNIFFNKALLLYQGVDDQEGVLLSSINLAEVALAQHDDAAATHYLTLAGRIATDDFFQHYQPRISLLYGRLALQQNSGLRLRIGCV